MLRPYRDLLRAPGALRLVLLSLLARLPVGMYAVLVLVLLERQTGTFAAGGAVTAAGAVGIGLSSPVRGRLLDRRGASSLIALSAANGATVLLLTLVAAPGRVWLLVALGFLEGATAPQFIAAMRVQWQRLVGRDTAELATAYAFETSAHIGVFFVGPLVATLGMALIGVEATLIVSAVLTVLAGWAFAAAATLPHLQAPDEGRRVLGSIVLPSVQSLVLVTALADTALGIVDVAAVAAATERGHAHLAGVLLAVFTAGSVIGGAAYGARAWTAAPQKRLLIVLGCFALALALLALQVPLTVFIVLLLVAGAPSAAQWSTTSVVLDAATPRAGAEPFTWLSSANAAGIALGGVVAGVLVDAYGTRPAFLAAAAPVALALVVAYGRRHTLQPVQPAPSA